MRQYELLFIVKPDVDEEQLEAVIGKYTALIEKEGGEIIKVDKWGKRKFAYEIDKKWRDGFYTLIQFNGEPAVASEVDRVMKISDEIIRHIITRIGE
ncbi:MAG: small subunit ribosomal protein [Clostridia bacterium]|jgi:small subunit ribosomal protein S6|nr:small subunit ribosomal protein [Clostridia bacterium]MDN5322573.1 small subunit ribosomal protein [Clostridia bacterium]